jgi:hypothetical protein
MVWCYRRSMVSQMQFLKTSVGLLDMVSYARQKKDIPE